VESHVTVRAVGGASHCLSKRNQLLTYSLLVEVACIQVDR